MSQRNLYTVVFFTLSNALTRSIYALHGANMFINTQAKTTTNLLNSIYCPISNIFDWFAQILQYVIRISRVESKKQFTWDSP